MRPSNSTIFRLGSTVFTASLFCISPADAAVRIALSEIVVAPIVKALVTSNFCPNNDIDVYKLGTSTTNLGNTFSIKCRSGNFSGTNENEIQVDASGGSLGAYLQSNSGLQEELATNGAFLSSSATGCASTAGAGSYSFIGSGRLKTCPTNTTLAAGKVVGGLFEMPVSLYAHQNMLHTQASYSMVSYSTSLTLTYGVAVSSSLFEALQQDQGLQVGTANATAANQPTISRAAITSLISEVYNDAKLKGLKSLAPSKAVEPITYCMLPRRSGVQAFANSYFLNAAIGSDGAAGGAVSAWMPPEDDLQYEQITAKWNANVSEQKACLSGPGHRIGFLPGTENPVKNAESFRFAKLNRVELSEGTVGATNIVTAKSGEYDFVSEINLFDPTNNTLLGKVVDILHYGGVSGIFINDMAKNRSFIQSIYGRGGNPLYPYSHIQYVLD